MNKKELQYEYDELCAAYHNLTEQFVAQIKENTELLITIDYYKADMETVRKISASIHDRMVEYRTKYMLLKRDTRIAETMRDARTTKETTPND